MTEIPVKVILDAIDNASKTIKGVGGSLEDFGTKARTVGTAMAAIGGVTALVTKSLIEQAGEFEQNTIAFETMLGSAEKANTLLTQIKDFAKKTPFNLSELVEGSKRLLAYNVEAEDLIPTLGTLGNITAGVGREKLPQLILAFGQVKAATRLTGAELRQFSEAGVPLLDTLAKQFGKTAAEIQDMIAGGEVSFDDVNKALSSMTQEGGKFFNLMDKQSKSTLGKVSNMQDAFQQMQVTIGKGLLPVANQLLEIITPLIQKFGDWAEKNPELVKWLLIGGLAIGAIGAVLLTLGLIIPPIIAGFALIGTVIGGLVTVITGAIGIIGAIVAILGGPLTLIILAIVAIVTFLALAWKNNWFDIQGKVEVAKELIMNAITGIIGFLQSLWDFILNLPTAFTQFVEQLQSSIYVFFTETLPYAIGFLVGRMVRFVTEDVPNFITQTINWFQQLPGKIAAFMTQMKDNIVNFFTQAKNSAITTTTNLVNTVVQWISSLPGSIENWLSKLPGIISKWFTDAKDKAVQIAKDMFNGVKEWFDKVINFFKDIVDWAGKAIGKIGEAATAGFNAGKRQFGGPVNSLNPVVVGEAGPEVFVPQTAGRVVPAHEAAGSGKQTTIQFIINADLIVNSPTERRSLAEALYKDLATLARSQNMSVAEMMGA